MAKGTAQRTRQKAHGDAPSVPDEVLRDFQAKVWREGTSRYRDLPWRNTTDPYAVLVSEVMLQQTQVARVLTRWEHWMHVFPTVDALASAASSDVLTEWQGLGYNRRALALQRAAQVCSEQYAGQVPSTIEELCALPGVGQATAAGVLAFAFNRPSVYIETNVRTVFLHELFPDQDEVSDKQLRPLVEATCSQDDPRGWYYALLDYGAYLKSVMPNPSRRSATYARQSSFEGSRRQKRAEVLRQVLDAGRLSDEALFAGLNESERRAGRPEVARELFDSIVYDMVHEGFFQRDGAELYVQ